MTANARILRALQMQRIAGTSRKTKSATSSTPNTPLILKSLPEHKPLLPLLLSYHIPSKLAKACADRYDRYADQLRSETESKLAPYLADHISGRPARVYSLFLDNYNQTLRDWAQSILNTALRNLKRDSAELDNWDVTYPPPLWLPLPPDMHPIFVQTNTQSTHCPCPFSSTSAPSHAFPTTYPPPLRPPSQLPRVEWTRIPATSPSPPSTSTIDLDSLCTQFTRTLVVGENSTRSPQPRPSIFSLPLPLKGSADIASPAKVTKRKASRARPSQESAVKPALTTPLFKTTKLRQHSAPPSFSLTSVTLEKIQHKADTFATPSTKRTTLTSLTHAGSHYHITSKSSRPGWNLDSIPSSVPAHSISNPMPDLKTFTAHNIPYPPMGPITPPTHSPDLFCEPVVVSSAPPQLSPVPFIESITDPLAQLQGHSSCLPNPPSVSPLDYDFSTLGLFASSHPQKATHNSSKWIPCNPVMSTLHVPLIGDLLGTWEVF